MSFFKVWNDSVYLSLIFEPKFGLYFGDSSSNVVEIINGLWTHDEWKHDFGEIIGISIIGSVLKLAQKNISKSETISRS